MKTSQITLAIALSSILAAPSAFAISDEDKKGLKGAAFFTGSAAVGAMVGGPAGMVIGAIGGALFDDQQNKKNDAQQSLEQANVEISQLENQIDRQEITLISLENKVAKKLEFQVMFPTGGDTLSFEDHKRIETLSAYLHENEKLRVRLDGHADPRGTDEYNNVLSAERAKSVANALEASGIEPHRIEVYAHGSSKVSAANSMNSDVTVESSEHDFSEAEIASTNTPRSTADDYAFARRVNIEVFSEEAHTHVSQTSF